MASAISQPLPVVIPSDRTVGRKDSFESGSLEIKETKDVAVPTKMMRGPPAPNAFISPSLKNSGFKGAKGGVSRRVGVVPTMPKQLQLATMIHGRLRYRVTSACAQESITCGNLLNAIGLVCVVSASEGLAIATSFRLLSITLWPPATTSDSVYFSFSQAYSPNIRDVIVDSSIPDGLTVSVPVKAVPAKNSLASFWFSIGLNGQEYGQITAPVGTIIDLVGRWTLPGQYKPLEITMSTGSANNFYYPPLDGSAAKILPVALPTAH